MKFEIDKSAHKAEITYKPLTFNELKLGDKFVFANSDGEPINEKDAQSMINARDLYMVVYLPSTEEKLAVRLLNSNCFYSFPYHYLKVIEKKD